MFKKGSKLYSITKARCPRCHEGDFFKYRFTFNPSKITQLHTNCPNCNLKYMMEPSFFYGAMYVNYGITVALSVITFLICTLIFNATLLQSFIAILIALLVLAPVNLRLSRILWIHMFVTYEEKSTKNENV
jgi:uncharacterized protein (DUF983 family)